MIQEDEHILFISQAKAAVVIKQTETVKTGFAEKKIVITTRRCLFFQCISNQVLEIEYELMSKKRKSDDDKKKQKEKKSKLRISVNQFPQHSFPINDRECKIMIDQQPSCHKYLQKIGLRNFLKSITGIVVLKNMPKMKFQLLSFPSLKDGFRFCKGIVCGQAWTVYQNYCKQNNVPVNKLWSRILCEIINNQKSIVLIDPDLFLSGNDQQIKSFLTLVNQIPFAHSFRHRYSITSQQIAEYSQNFLEMFQERTHSLIFQHNNLTSNYLSSIFSSRIKLDGLLHLDLSHNKLTDETFILLQRFAKQCKKLSHYCLSHNQINLTNYNLLINFLKGTQVMLSLDLSYNNIDDSCVQTIEKFIILPANPPLDQINLSFNKFTKKAAWRMFVGNSKYSKYHPYMNFIIYPIPVKLDIFPDTPLEYPTPSPLMNFNIHSALVEQFEQQSFMKHTLHQILNPDNTTIKLIRRLPDNMKLPRTKQEVYKCTQMANKIQNFMYSPQFVENLFDLAQQIQNFPFNLNPVSKGRYIKYLSDKLNQALFIRDHYSVRFILKAFRVLKVDYKGYEPRIKRLQLRNEIINKKMENILNFDTDEIGINHELDEIVREGLRLYLNGNGIQGMYYLKYLRDQWVQKLIKTKYNPEHFITERLADKNMNFEDDVTEKQLVIPYQIRVQKKINQNFYLHPWKTNYLLLSQIHKAQFDECLQFLEKSSKKEKFAIYFQRIQERIQFMRNQFSLFNYNKFKITYSDLKINCSRLLSMYRFIGERNYFLEVPSFTRKLPITKEKVVTIMNQTRFKDEYHISKYPNINLRARKAGFYNYNMKMTKYGSDLYLQEFLKLKNHIDTLFKIIQTHMKNNRIPQQIMNKLQEIIKYIRQSLYPEELKEQFYLRILSWRNGRHSNNIEILTYLPFLSMYLKPPLTMEKYLVSAILSSEVLNLGEMPLCLVTDVNKVTQANVKELQANYIQRDWMACQKNLVSLMKESGKVHIEVQLLTKQKISYNPRQSSTVANLVSNLSIQLKQVEDISHFWLYLGYAGESNLIILQQSQHLGEILCEKQDKEKYFVLKRRIYCPEWKYIYKTYSQSVINNLFYDWRYEYLLGQFFINKKEVINLAASLIIIDTVDESLRKKNFNQLINMKIKNLGSFYKGYMPTQVVHQLFKNPSQLIGMLKEKINEKVMKKQNLKGLETKKQILGLFQDYPEFFSTNHIFVDKNFKSMKISINCFHVYINSIEEIETIALQKVISIIPKAKYLLINYHRHEGIIGKVSLFGDERKILTAAQDILAYCMLRIKMTSPTLYGAYRYENLVSKANKNKGEQINLKEQQKEKEMSDNIRRLRKKLGYVNPTIVQHEYLPYYTQCKYIKVFTNRKLYANASQDQLQMIDDGGQTYEINKNYNSKMKPDESMNVSQHNAFKTLFPQYKYENSEDRNPDNSQMPSFNKSLQQSLIYPQKDLNNSSVNYNNYQPPKEQRDLDQPPEITPIKKPVEDPDEYDPVTTAQRPRNRLPPKRNR